MDPLTNIWQVAAALAVIVAVVYGLGLLAKRMQGLATGGTKHNKLIKVVESAYLGPKERLVMVEVGEERFLLAINPQSISKVGEFNGNQFAALLEQCERAS